MKWKRIAVSAVFLSFLVFLGWGCSGTHKTDCKQKIKEIRTMIDTTIMDYGDYEVMLPPSTYCAGDEIRYVFAVPKDNMVGTNELDNAIKLLEFKSDEELEQHVIKKDFMEMVTWPFEFRFLPLWSDKEVAYSQSRGFLLTNLLEKKVNIHTVIPGLDDLVENLQVLEGNNHTFVFEINLPGEGLGNHEKILKVIRFEDGNFAVLSEHPAGIKTGAYTEPWFVYQKRIFIYNDSTTKLESFDENFKPTTHPLAEAFNRNRVEFRCMQEIAIHPTLPFALIIEQGKMPTKAQLAAADALPDPADEKARDAIYAEVNRLTLHLFR